MEGFIFRSITDEKFSAKIHQVPFLPPKVGALTFVELEGTKFPQYKYIEKKWALEFFQTGQLRIGTLHDFSRVDLHGDRRGDRNEGARNYHRFDDNSYPIVVSTISVNSYTFCTSNIVSDDIAKEFGADCIIEISSIDFFFEISKVMTMKYSIGSSTIGPVNYVDNEEVANYVSKLIDNGLKDDQMNAHMPDFARLKDKEFSSQGEVRAMWEPANPSAKLWPAGRPRVPSEIYDGISPYDRRYSSVNEELQAIFPIVPRARDYCRLIQI